MKIPDTPITLRWRSIADRIRARGSRSRIRVVKEAGLAAWQSLPRRVRACMRCVGRTVVELAFADDPEAESHLQERVIAETGSSRYAAVLNVAGVSDTEQDGERLEQEMLFLLVYHMLQILGRTVGHESYIRRLRRLAASPKHRSDIEKVLGELTTMAKTAPTVTPDSRQIDWSLHVTNVLALWGLDATMAEPVVMPPVNMQ